MSLFASAIDEICIFLLLFDLHILIRSYKHRNCQITTILVFGDLYSCLFIDIETPEDAFVRKFITSGRNHNVNADLSGVVRCNPSCNLVQVYCGLNLSNRSK